MERWMVIFVLFGLIFVICKAIRQEIRVDGDDFVSYDMSSIPGLRKNHTVKLEFKTVHPNGVLMYIGSEEKLKDFVMLDLVHGKLRVTVSLGDIVPAQKEDLVFDGDLIDNEWHKIKLSLERRQLNVTIDGNKHLILLKSNHIPLNINGFTYIGGITKGIVNILQKYKPSPNFKGCITKVYFRKLNILAKGIKKKNEGKNGYSEYGSPEYTCRGVRFKTLSFGYPEAFLKFPSTGSIYTNVKMRFRTYLADGILVSKGVALGGLPFVSVSLIEGEVFLKVRMTVRGQVIELSRGKHLNDGEWHSLSVFVNKTLMKLKVDELDELVHFRFDRKQIENKDNDLFIGYNQSFFGCIHDLNVDDNKIDLTNIPLAHKSGALRNRCNLVNLCFPNPCLHGGKCNEVRFGGFSCDCENTFYYGRICKKPIYLRTCQKYRNLGLAEDAYCKVDLDAEGPLEPFEVLCNVSKQNRTMTVVKHNKIGPQRVGVSYNKFITNIAYFHHVTYSLKMKEISALIVQSEGCRQFVSFKCFGSKLLQAPTRPAEVSFKGASSALVSDRWPREPAGSDKCACKVNGTCADPHEELSCNCDVGDETWREGGGYITNKWYLPLTVFQFLPSAAQSNFTVGPLECFGTLTRDSSDSEEETLEMQRMATRFFYSLCHAVNPTTPQLRSIVPTPARTPAFWRRFQEKKTSTVGTTVSTATTEMSSSQSTASDASVPTAKTAFDHGSFAESKPPSTTTSSPFIVHLSTEKMNSHSPTSNTLALGGSNGNPVMVDRDESTKAPTAMEFSWQIVVTIILLVVVSIMFITAVVYFFKKQSSREFSCGLVRPKKPQPLAEVNAGFPEVKMRSRSGEVDLPDVRRSIEAGSYNVRTGLIAYGGKF